MNKEEFLKNIKREYFIARLLSERNGAVSYVLKHKTLGKNIVLRLFDTPVPIYDFLKTISFKNLPCVYDVIYLDDAQAVLEEYIDGLSAADVLESGKYTYRGARKVLLGVCDALEVIHSQGFAHRDIKPENVMITTDGNVKLIDFNASRIIKPEASRDTLAIGTIGYASPEQLGISQSDARTDIYALGVLLNIMLTGEHPSKIIAGGRAEKIILKCTQISPEKRYKNVTELKKDM